MSCVVVLPRSRLWSRAATLALMVGLAGCSSDSARLNDMNGYGSWGSEPTGSVPHGAPAGRIESRPLPPQQHGQYGQSGQYGQVPPPHQPAAAPLASYTPAAHSSHPLPAGAPPAGDVTGSVGARPVPSGHWTAEGGTSVTVVQGDNIDAIARRYGVPGAAIMHANNLPPSAPLRPGQQLVIPRYSQLPPAAAGRAPAPAQGPAHVATPKPANAASPVGNPGVHVVAQGETLSKISRLYNKPIGEIARANNIQVTSRLIIGDRLVIPGMRATAALKPKATTATTTTPAPPAAAASQPRVAAAAPKEPPEPPTMNTITPTADPPGDPGKAADAGGLPKFRWPANGRVIAGFGPGTNGQQNDGINIALPENTAVKAAEDGVVAYAGNELKGYGNLVLVRHPNGYVTAYAHAKELLVKRGDQVKRGQPIARSGQTGNVNAPQLHFEIRKGASPLDPMKFLNGA